MYSKCMFGMKALQHKHSMELDLMYKLEFAMKDAIQQVLLFVRSLRKSVKESKEPFAGATVEKWIYYMYS